jgi:virginiamycin B lyase
MKLISALVNRVKKLKTTPPRPFHKPFRVRPALEHLEDRCLPSTVTELPVLPTLNAAPTGITSANDGSIWFTERSANKLGRLGSHGALTEYVIPTASSAPEQITASPDGYVWFTERYGKKIGRISQAGGPIKEFQVPGYGAYATAITTVASTGQVWFASVESSSVARLGRISSTGVITMLPTANTSAVISSLVGGPDGNLWVTRVSNQWGDSVSKVVTVGWGSWTHYKLTPYSNPQYITVGTDNNLWFTQSSGNKIGRMTTAGVRTDFALPVGSKPQQIVAGPDGAMWFTEKGSHKIGRMTTDGQLSELALATTGASPFGITKRQDGTLWFTEQGGNRLGQVVVS